MDFVKQIEVLTDIIDTSKDIPYNIFEIGLKKLVKKMKQKGHKLTREHKLIKNDLENILMNLEKVTVKCSSTQQKIQEETNKLNQKKKELLNAQISLEKWANADKKITEGLDNTEEYDNLKLRIKSIEKNIKQLKTNLKAVDKMTTSIIEDRTLKLPKNT